MARAEHVARYFLWLSVESEPTPLTQLHLHKLLYYAQGWSLAAWGERLFDEAIQAWRHGPVVPSVYPSFADYGSSAIAQHEAREASELTRAERGLVEVVWREYGRFSAWKLREMTHSERPWLEAREGTPEGSPSQSVMRDETIRAHFLAVHDRACRRIGTTSEAFARALAEAKSGKTVLLSELRGALPRAAG